MAVHIVSNAKGAASKGASTGGIPPFGSKMAAVPQLTKSAQLIVQLAEPTVAFYLEPTAQKMVAHSTEGRNRNVTKHRELMRPGGVFIGRRPQKKLLPPALLNA